MLAGANPAVANSAAFSAMENANMPTITSVVFDGFLSDCTVRPFILTRLRSCIVSCLSAGAIAPIQAPDVAYIIWPRVV